jgi:hypothetical protein
MVLLARKMLNIHDILRARTEFNDKVVFKSHQRQAAATRAYLGVAYTSPVTNELAIPPLSAGPRVEYVFTEEGQELRGAGDPRDARNAVAEMVKKAMEDRRAAASGAPTPTSASTPSILQRDVAGMVSRPAQNDTEAVEEMDELEKAVDAVLEAGGLDRTVPTTNTPITTQDFVQQLRDTQLMTSETYELSRATVEKLIAQSDKILQKMLGASGSMFSSSLRSQMRSISSSLKTRMVKFNLTDNPSVQTFDPSAVTTTPSTVSSAANAGAAASGAPPAPGPLTERRKDGLLSDLSDGGTREESGESPVEGGIQRGLFQQILYPDYTESRALREAREKVDINKKDVQTLTELINQYRKKEIVAPYRSVAKVQRKLTEAQYQLETSNQTLATLAAQEQDRVEDTAQERARAAAAAAGRMTSSLIRALAPALFFYLAASTTPVTEEQVSYWIANNATSLVSSTPEPAPYSLADLSRDFGGPPPLLAGLLSGKGKRKPAQPRTPPKKRKRGGGAAAGSNERLLQPAYEEQTDSRAWRDQMPASLYGSQPKKVRFTREVPNTGLVGRAPGRVSQFKPTKEQLAAVQSASQTGIPATDTQSMEVLHQQQLAEEDIAMEAGAPLQTRPFRLSTKPAKHIRKEHGVGPAGASTRHLSQQKKKRLDSVFQALGAASE